MGITQLIDPFYEELSPEEFRRKPTMGQLCWVPSPHLNVIPQVLEIQRADPTEHHIGQFKIRNVQENDFQRKDELPLYKLKLRLHEELIIQKAKRRPAIVLITTNTIKNSHQKGIRKMDINKIDLLLKLYSRSGKWGPIHLIKYTYLADLAFTEKYGGETDHGRNH